MNDEPLHAHSVAEAYLFLMATPCARCGRGAVTCATKRRMTEFENGQWAIEGTCTLCGHRREYGFRLPDDHREPDRNDLYPIVNDTDAPSRIIDVGQWITLFRMILEAAEKESDKVEARRLGYEAAQCLEEAIKFYEDDELPPDDAFFTESSRAYLRRDPQQFAKQRLLDLRAKLPQTSRMRDRLSRDAGGGRPWWKFWG